MRKKGVINFIKNGLLKTAIISASFFFIIAGLSILWVSNLKIPDFNYFGARKISQSTKIFDRTGNILLYDIHQDVKRTIVPYENISRNIKNATIAIEDSDFYNHRGIKLSALARALFVDITTGSAKQGGSTITQQVVKNTILTGEKSIARKIKEIVLALKLEREMNKEQILALYLNESPYGGTIYGVEEASQKFFGKKADEVTLAEAAYLASIPNAPTYYSPYGQNKDKLNERKNTVLNRMIELDFISQNEADEAKKEIVSFLPIQNTGGIKAPHFVEFVRAYLENTYGEEELETRGFNVITTLDWELEQQAEETVAKFGKENEEKFNAKNAGMIGLDPKTGQILVMVGSRDYFNKENDGNFNVTLGHRQPGSSFKPFVYATAFNKGYRPETTLFDLETEFQTTCAPEGVPINPDGKPEECYKPQNYDEKFRGPISLREALSQSINIPSIKLLYLVGIKNTIKTAKEMGITGLIEPDRYGLTLVLGGGEVTLLDLTSAYSVFANDGIRNPYSSILKITDSEGGVVESFTQNPRRVLPENTARNISSILSDNVARLPAYGPNSPLKFDERDVAAKTGTTNDTRDAWVIGYTPNFTLGVWVGNNDNSEMVKKVAGMITAPMWRDMMLKVLKTIPDEKFIKPSTEGLDGLKPVLKGDWKGGLEYTIDKMSGKLATENTPDELKEKRSVIQVHSILAWVNKNDPLGPAPEDPRQDPQFNLWETPIRKWVAENGIIEDTIASIPNSADDIHGSDFAPKINIISPIPQITYEVDKNINISIQVIESKFPVSQADFFVNGEFLGSSKISPFNFYFNPLDIQTIKAINELRVIVYDIYRNKTETATALNISI